MLQIKISSHEVCKQVYKGIYFSEIHSQFADDYSKNTAKQNMINMVQDLFMEASEMPYTAVENYNTSAHNHRNLHEA